MMGFGESMLTPRVCWVGLQKQGWSGAAAEHMVEYQHASVVLHAGATAWSNGLE